MHKEDAGNSGHRLWRQEAFVRRGENGSSICSHCQRFSFPLRIVTNSFLFLFSIWEKSTRKVLNSREKQAPKPDN